MWEDWEEAREANKNKRLNWRRILPNGVSLNQFVAEMSKRYDKDAIIKTVWAYALQHPEEWRGKGITEEELMSRIKVGVTARIAEKKMESITFRAKVYQGANGGLYIYITRTAKELGIKPGDVVEVEVGKVDWIG